MFLALASSAFIASGTGQVTCSSGAAAFLTLTMRLNAARRHAPGGDVLVQRSPFADIPAAAVQPSSRRTDCRPAGHLPLPSVRYISFCGVRPTLQS